MHRMEFMRRGWPSSLLLPLMLAMSACLLTVEATSRFIPGRGQLRAARSVNQTEKQKAVLPKGTSIHVRLTDSIRVDFHRAGGSFNGVLDRAIKIDDQVLAPEKSRVIGQVTKLAAADKADDTIQIELVLRKLQIGGQTIPLETETLEFTVPRGTEALAIYRELAVDPDVIYRPATRLTFKLSKPVRLSPADPGEQ